MAIEERIILTADASDAAKNLNRVNSALTKLDSTLDKVGKTVKDIDYSNLKEASAAIDALSKTLTSDTPKVLNNIAKSFSNLNNSLENFSSVDRFEELKNSIAGVAQYIDNFTGLAEALQLLSRELKNAEVAANGTKVEIRDTADGTGELTVSVKNLSDTGTTATTSLKSLRDEVKRAQNDLLNSQKGTDEYTDALERLTEANSQLQEVQLLTSRGAGDLANVFSNTTRVLRQGVQLFQTTQGVISLLNVESADFEKTLVKLQATLAIVNGVAGLATLPRNLLVLRRSLQLSRLAVVELTSALLTNPLVAFGVAAAALAVTLYSLRDAFFNTKEQADDAKAANDRFILSIQRSNDVAEYNIELLSAQGASQEELIKKQRYYTQQRLDLLNAEFRALFDQVRELQRLNRRRDQDLIKQLVESGNEIAKIIAQTNKELESLDRRANVNRLKIQTDEAKKRSAAAEQQAKKDLDEVKKILNDVQNVFKSSYEISFQQLTGEYNRRRALLIKYNKDTLDLELKYQQDVIALQKQRDVEEVQQINNRIENNLAAQQKEYDLQIAAFELQSADMLQRLAEFEQQLQEQTAIGMGVDPELLRSIAETESMLEERNLQLEFQRIERYEAYVRELEDTLSLEQLSSDQRISLQEQLNTAYSKLQKDRADYTIQQINRETTASQRQADIEARIKREREALINSYTNSLLTGAAAAVSILGSESVAGKAIAVAGATIDTYRAATQTLATPGLPYPARVAATAATIAQGLASVKNILSVNPLGENNISTGGNSGAFSPYEVPTTTAPNIEDYYEPFNTRAVTELNSTEDVELNRVYVLESDIANATFNSQVRISESTF